MYSRQLDEDGDAALFGVSGKLWNGVLVMFDRESGSLWTQIDGRAIQGDRRGQRLRHRHSEHTDWATWKAQHPDTLVLEKDDDALAQIGSRYADYLSDPDRLFMDELAEGLGGVGPKDTVFGIALDGQALAVTQSVLEAERIVNATLGATPVAWLYDPETGFVRAIERRLEGRVLVLEPVPGQDPRLLFRDTTSGEVRGFDELTPVRVDRAFWYAWKRSHPSSRVISD